MEVCFRISCSRCEEKLLVWVEPIDTNILTDTHTEYGYCGENRLSFDEDRFLVFRQMDVWNRVQDEGWNYSWGVPHCDKCGAG